MPAFLTKRTLLTVFFLFICIGLLVWILPVSIPLLLALFTAFLLEPFVRTFIRHYGWSRKVSVIAVFLLFTIFLGLIGFFISTKIIGEIIQVAEDTPAYLKKLNSSWIGWEKTLYDRTQDLPPEIITAAADQRDHLFQTVQTYLTGFINVETIKSVLMKIPNYFVSFIVYLIALFLFLLDFPKLKEKVQSLLPHKTADKMNFVFSRLSYVIFGFVKAQFLISFIIFVTSLIGLFFISPQIAPVAAFLIWLFDFIPIFGSILLLAPWAGYWFITGGIATGTKLVILGILLLIIRRTLEPKVMGYHIGLSPLATLITMYAGLKLFGMIGLLAGPLFLIAFKSAREAGIISFNFKI